MNNVTTAAGGGAIDPIRQAQLLWHTVRYLRLSQITSRLQLRAGAALRRLSPAATEIRYARLVGRSGLHPPTSLWRERYQGPIDRSQCLEHEWVASLRRAQSAESGAFTFLSESVELGRPISWEAPATSQLWRYQLHYCGYLVDMVATQEHGWNNASRLMSEWITACPMGEVKDAWHPYVVSERLVNWLFAIQLGAPSVRDVPAPVWLSLAQQTIFITRNLENDVGGNHLLKNLKALSIASCIWCGPVANQWRDRYVAAFDRELANQLLTDGAHYERSPMYHSLVLADAIEVILVLRLAEQAVPDTLAESVRAMANHLATIQHPDGDIALFNDSVHGEAPTPRQLRAATNTALGHSNDTPISVRHALLAAAATRACSFRAATVTRPATEDCGIVRLPVLGERGLLLIDVGRACPDDLPAHAHADFFSFELSLDQRRMIVDSGVGEYAAGDWREYYRSSRAHNTVTIDGFDQIECWGSFRVARRANVTDRCVIDSPAIKGVSAWHDGYKRLQDPVAVGRTVVALDDRAWVVLDEFVAKGVHGWNSCVHASPDAELSIVAPERALISMAGRRLAIAWFGMTNARRVRGQKQPMQGWHAAHFGRHLPSWTLVIEGRSSACGYVLAPDFDPEEVDIAQGVEGLTVCLGDSRYRITGSGTSMVARLEVTN